MCKPDKINFARVMAKVQEVVQLHNQTTPVGSTRVRDLALLHNKPHDEANEVKNLNEFTPLGIGKSEWGGERKNLKAISTIFN